MRSLYRAVILGNPGGGKTTLIQKLCYDLIKHYNQRLFANRLVSPMPIVLRDYGNERKLRGYSIVDYIESYANTHLQIKAHPGAIEYLLRNGRVVVMFDGLDELIDTSYRRVITEDIESFCHAYPSVPILVTSREVGYEQAPLSAEFTVFRLSPFNEEQVSEYVTKWFSTDSTLSRHQQKQQTDSFLAQSLIVPDIRDNPLMLALMCNLYKGENYIPRNRPDVYEKCASMLFERWDKQRGIVVPLPFEHSIRSATRFLAYWIYSSQDLQAGVTEAKLVRECTEYLCGRRFDDRDEAESAARQFVEFCHGRAWVFTDVGTTANGEKIYQFTHRTFLEYFAAAHLVSTNYTPKQLLAVMRPRIAVREWDNLAQLAFQIQSRSLDGAADELLLGIVTSPSEDRGRRYNELHFVARCLAFLVPTPKVTREVVGCAMRAFLDNRGSQSTEAIFRSLLDSAEENQIAVLSAIETIFVDHISHITAIGDLILTLRSVFCLPGGNQQGTEQERKLPKSMNQGRNKLSNPIGRILDASKENLIKHGKFNRQVANELLWRSILSMSDYLNWHADLYQMFFPDGNGLSSVSSRPIVDGLLQGLNTGQGAGFASWLIEFGLFLMPKPLPWFIVPWSSRREALRERAKSCFFSVRDSLQLRKSHKQLSPIDSDIVWGAFCLSALLLELSAVPMSRRCWLAEFLLVFCPDVQWQEDKSLSTDGFNAQGLRLGEQKIQLILNWSRGEIDLTDFCAS